MALVPGSEVKAFSEPILRPQLTHLQREGGGNSEVPGPFQLSVSSHYCKLMY